jgi:DNA polymerase family B
VEAYDIETFKNNLNNHTPYCVCFSFKTKMFSVYYEENVDIISASIDLIFSFIKTKVYYYVHNLNFDGILILASLTKQNKYIFSMFSRELNIYEVRIEDKTKIIIFKCSYKILPLSLKKISEGFDLPSKMPFPYNFITEEKINFIGKTPDKLFFNSEKD